MFAMNIVGDSQFDALRGGLPTDEQRGYFRDMYQNAVSYLDNTRKEFVERSRDLYRTLNNSQAAEIARKLKRSFRGAYTSGIGDLVTVSDFQDCSRRQQQWLMSDPELRAMADEGIIEGYGLEADRQRDSLMNQSITNGVMMVSDKGEAHYDVHYFVETDNIKQCTFDEQALMMKLRRRVREMIEEGGQDPTSQYGAEIA